ncbi:hypothetical protein HaLaN_04162 [Haematococcus lacustris]|uniref:Uncharacterized protein n=1 Tax=Haematococcus lacustris TaxID=44745 RepID=A0A699YG84_HAELA|nr:hypothetical protein HaLaN_04162 [Haematococcus lacustris]
MRCMLRAALQSLSTHLPACGAGLALAAWALPLPLVGWVCSAASGSALVRLLRLAGRGVLGPGSEAAAYLAAWLLRGACGGLRGATTGHHIMPRTGWSRCWLQAGRSRRGSTCPAGGFQPAGLAWHSQLLFPPPSLSPTHSHLLNKAHATTLSLHTNPPPLSSLTFLSPTHPHLLEELLQRPILGSVQPQPLPCPLGVQVHLPHRVPGGQGGGDVLQARWPLLATGGPAIPQPLITAERKPRVTPRQHLPRGSVGQQQAPWPARPAAGAISSPPWACSQWKLREQVRVSGEEGCAAWPSHGPRGSTQQRGYCQAPEGQLSSEWPVAG